MFLGLILIYWTSLIFFYISGSLRYIRASEGIYVQYNKVFFLLLITGKSGNSKDICGDDKQKEDGDPWNEAQAAFLGPNLWDKTLPYDADLKVHQVSICTSYLLVKCVNYYLVFRNLVYNLTCELDP